MLERIKKYNDDGLEVLVAFMRTLSLLAVVGVFVAACGYAWTWEARWLAVLAACTLVAAGSGWVGWYAFGNSNWRRNAARD